jgi:hypothetical protein
LVISKKIRHQKTGRANEKKKAKMKFSLRVESCGKESRKIFGQEILWERKKKNKKRKRTKREIIGKIRNLSTIW